MARALFDIKPLPPYHHVPNVDKSSVSTEAQPFRASQKSPVAMAVKKAYDNTALPRTVTHLDDFHPKPYGAPKLANEDGAYKRPMMLGVLLTPKKTSVVKVEQQDEWDFVLRHLFVRQAQTLEKALPSLGFNAGSLQKDISSKGNLYAGKPVDCSKIVRDLDENEWARIVDVFANWPFKPDVSRSIGHCKSTQLIVAGSHVRQRPRTERHRLGSDRFCWRLNARIQHIMLLQPIPRTEIPSAYWFRDDFTTYVPLSIVLCPYYPFSTLLTSSHPSLRSNLVFYCSHVVLSMQ